jgi:hypothetical protein
VSGVGRSGDDQNRKTRTRLIVTNNLAQRIPVDEVQTDVSDDDGDAGGEGLDQRIATFGGFDDGVASQRERVGATPAILRIAIGQQYARPDLR